VARLGVREGSCYGPGGGPRGVAVQLSTRSTEAGAWQISLRRNGAPWRCASHLLAYCDMRTLYLRNVPDDVVARLERLAARDATSVGAVAVRELAEVSRRADNPALLGSLPDLGVNAATILHDLDAGRADR
jgi:hypothetical protein